MPDLTRVTAETFSEEARAQIADLFEYHPWDAQQKIAGDAVRMSLASAYQAIIVNVPPCPTRTVALRKITEARMDANSAITHGGKY